MRAIGISHPKNLRKLEVPNRLVKFVPHITYLVANDEWYDKPTVAIRNQ